MPDFLSWWSGVSYGCINVPPGFFTQIVSPDFTPAKGIVYVLPETRSAAQLFGFQPPVTSPPASPMASEALTVSRDGARPVPAAGAQ